jgi:hypothetical protein
LDSRAGFHSTFRSYVDSLLVHAPAASRTLFKRAGAPGREGDTNAAERQMIRISAQLSKFRTLAGVLFTLLLTFIGLTAITFVIGRVMPADPVLAIIGDRASQEVYERTFQEMGLDRPLYEQYWRYLSQLVQGDLGTSIMTAQPVMEDILRFFPATLELATIATLMGIFIGIPGSWTNNHPPVRGAFRRTYWNFL